MVCHDLTGRPLTTAGLFGLGHRYQTDLDKWAADDAACDFIFIGRPHLRLRPAGMAVRPFGSAEAWAQHEGASSATTRCGPKPGFEAHNPTAVNSTPS